MLERIFREVQKKEREKNCQNFLFFWVFPTDFSKYAELLKKFQVAVWYSIMVCAYSLPNGFQVNAKKESRILKIFYWLIVVLCRSVRLVKVLKEVDRTRNWPNARPPSPCCRSWDIPGPLCNRPSRHSRTPTPMDPRPPAARPPPLCPPRR